METNKFRELTGEELTLVNGGQIYPLDDPRPIIVPIVKLIAAILDIF